MASGEIITGEDEPLLTVLERFNRKERFILLEQATADQGHIAMSPSFLKKLSVALGDIEIPPNPEFVAMDFHLNWLYAALELTHGEWVSPGAGLKAAQDVPRLPNPAEPPTHRHAIERNQEDVDLIVGWVTGDTCHLALVEAKAYSGWSSKQMTSKITRLRTIFGESSGGRYHGVIPHLVLASFANPTKLDTSTWPEWTMPNGYPAHLRLDPPQSHRLHIGETDATGKPTLQGGHFAIRQLGPTHSEHKGGHHA